MEQAQGWGLGHLQALCMPAVTVTALKWQVQIIQEVSIQHDRLSQEPSIYF